MAKFYDSLDEGHCRFIEAQKIFFVATVSAEKGINLSPKGIVPLKILDKNRVAYLDFFGSGNRTAEDIAEGSLVTVMFCSFDEEPKIMRLFCKGESFQPGHSRFDEIIGNWDGCYRKRTRNIFVFNISTVQTSCGYGVPMFEYKGDKEAAAKLTDLPSVAKE